MSDASGIPSVLGIEAVEWFAEGGENLTVRVTGRWRRRRPAWSAQPILVVEAAGRRFRFPAMPEPPSLTGAGPGTWRISFAVPAALAPELGGRTWLQFGAVVVPLPAAAKPLGDIAAQAEAAPAPAMPKPEQAEAPGSPPSPPSSELEAEDARRRAGEAERTGQALAARVEELERELATLQLEAQRLSATVSERERSRRAAEQRAHAAQAQRHDLARQLSARAAEAERSREALGALAAAEERIRELELELGLTRRRVDEAEQAAASAAAARRRAEQVSPEPRSGPGPAREPLDEPRAGPVRGEHDRLRLEHRLIASRARAGGRVPSEPSAVSARASPAAGTSAPGRPKTPARPSVEPDPGRDALVSALRRELDARAGAEAALRARLLDAEGTLAARSLIERRTAGILAQLREELDGLRAAFEREHGARVDAERRAQERSRQASSAQQRSREAYDAIAELREALEDLRAPPPNPEAESAPGTQGSCAVEPERLNDARLRLRQAIAPHEADAATPLPSGAPGAVSVPEAERTGRGWLEPIWERLARTDPGAAGRLLIELLPAQHETFPPAVSYDLVFGAGRGSAQVTVRDGSPVIRHADGPRPRREVDFQVFGDPTAIARLLIAGPLRRRFGRGVARVRGRRERLAALRSLVGVRLDLRGLHRIGVRFEPGLALTLIALMIDPEWTARERFAVAYAAPDGFTSYLLVRDGAPIQVTTEAPAAGVTTTLSGPADASGLALSGERSDEITVVGEEWPLALLRKWIKRAQSG